MNAASNNKILVVTNEPRNIPEKQHDSMVVISIAINANDGAMIAQN